MSKPMGVKFAKYKFTNYQAIAIREFLLEKRQFAKDYHMLQRKYACNWLLEELKK